MSLTAFAIRIVFLALPGIVASKTYRKLRGRTPRRRWEDLVEVLLFALLSYFLWWGFTELVLPLFRPLQPGGETQTASGSALMALEAFVKEGTPLQWGTILGASVTGVLLGFLAAYNHKYSVLMRLSRWIRATRRTGDEDIWEVFLNSPDTQWCVVRDHAKNLMYYGFVRYYSDSEKERELVLENVSVYTNDAGEELYTTGVMYVSRPAADLTIEVPMIVWKKLRHQEIQKKGSANEQDHN